MLCKIKDLKKYIKMFDFDDVVEVKKININADTSDISEKIKKEIKIKDAKVKEYELKNEVIDGLNYISLYKNSKKIGFFDIIAFYMVKLDIPVQMNAIQVIAKDFNIKHKEADYYMKQKDIFLKNIDTMASIDKIKWDFPFLYKKVKKEITFYNALNSIAITMITQSKDTYKGQQMLRLPKRSLDKYFLEYSDLRITSSAVLRSLNYLVLLGFLEKVSKWDIPKDLLEYDLKNKDSHKNIPSYYIIKPLTLDLLSEIEDTAKLLDKNKITKSNITSERIRKTLGTYHYNRLYLNTHDNINAIKFSKNKKEEALEKTILKYNQYMPF